MITIELWGAVTQFTFYEMFSVLLVSSLVIYTCYILFIRSFQKVCNYCWNDSESIDYKADYIGDVSDHDSCNSDHSCDSHDSCDGGD